MTPSQPFFLWRTTAGRGWSGLRMAACVLLAVLAAMWLSALVLGRLGDARMQAQLQAQQTQEADLWARWLTARLEAHQRLLSVVAEGLHTSLLDQPAVLDGLMQHDGAMLRILESLHVMLPSGQVSHHGALGASTPMDTQGVDALRRTLAEGKAVITYVPAATDSLHWRLLLTVPMRSAQGAVTGAVAAIVRLPLAGLMPDASQSAPIPQHVLVDGEGVVLLHTDATQRWPTMRHVLGAQWRTWSQQPPPPVLQVDTQPWGPWLVSRVGLPFSQWQVVVLRQLPQPLAWGLLPRLPLAIWGGLGLGAVLCTGLAMWLLRRQLAAGPRPPEGEAASAPGSALARHLSLQAGAIAMFEAVPSAMLLEHEGRVTLSTPQVAVMLGYFGVENEQPALVQWLEGEGVLAAVHRDLLALGCFEGRLQLRKKDGDWQTVDVLVWVPSQLSSATVWRLQLPWRQWRAMPLPEREHVWRDAGTGMPNREAFLWGLQSWVSDSMRAPPPAADAQTAVHMPAQGCLLFADLDHLGLMNICTSREMGDQILRHVGRLVASYTHPLGNAARLGGDEFAVLLPGISLAHAQAVGQALCDAVWRWQPSWGGERHWVGLSVGVVAVDALRHTPQQALHAADMACYEAKRRGRSQVAVGQIAAQSAVRVASG